MKRLVFDTAALKNNVAAVRKRAGEAVVFAVLVGDGYGAGLVDFAKTLREEGITHFAVDEPEDVRRLREAGFQEESILMLRSTVDRAELETLLSQRAICTIGSYETGAAVNAAAEALGIRAQAHVLIDTGMGFGGFLPGDRQKLLSIYQNLPNVSIAGTYTYLCAANSDTTRQMSVFQGVLDDIHAAHLEPGMIHAAGSSALMSAGGVSLDAVRVGSAFLGTCRRKKRNSGLRPVCRGEATLETVRWLPKGHTIGNEYQIILRRPTRVGILPVGYKHGFGLEHTRKAGLFASLRAWRAKRRRFVTIDGKKARILGAIGALETAVDITDLKCAEGDVAVFQIDTIYARGLPRVFQ